MSHPRALFVALLLAALPSAAQAQATVLYQQDFENPTGFTTIGPDVSQVNVNTLYNNQPPGFVFSQANTVETLRIGGSDAFGVGYSDPSGIGGSYALGLLSNLQNDFLGLAFNIGTFNFLNFRLDISSIDLDGLGGPFVPVGGLAPTYRFSLFDNPTGLPGLGGGTALSTVDATGTVSPNKYTFDWTNVVAALDASGNTNGNVILRIDLLSGGYAAMDNFVIAASNTAGDVPPSVPEPATVVLLATALLAMGSAGYRRGGRTRSASRA